MNKYIQKILTKEMTRKEFLTYLGMLLLTIFGISAFLKNLASLNPGKKVNQTKVLSSKSLFGSGPYGV